MKINFKKSFKTEIKKSLLFKKIQRHWPSISSILLILTIPLLWNSGDQEENNIIERLNNTGWQRINNKEILLNIPSKKNFYLCNDNNHSFEIYVSSNQNMYSSLTKEDEKKEISIQNLTCEKEEEPSFIEEV